MVILPSCKPPAVSRGICRITSSLQPDNFCVVLIGDEDVEGGLWANVICCTRCGPLHRAPEEVPRSF
ncbi:hypothetical protein FVEG_11164 [Fusarium verticillioides 7600]|uniref:Uncharacterized protein n=1 Tax=Gibberella moniliformis (strain M3125 / FGSC 7600) TaxID=334819 RepID=W7MLP9_GIBM7|nr:hypothetical protein FVEG_11164 [Fusarium verticillioides 7600]EWG52403.1 hypothetical protein FVEG_11164 [Fusarium verticillioides 7600]